MVLDRERLRGSSRRWGIDLLKSAPSRLHRPVRVGEESAARRLTGCRVEPEPVPVRARFRG